MQNLLGGVSSAAPVATAAFEAVALRPPSLPIPSIALRWVHTVWQGLFPAIPAHQLFSCSGLGEGGWGTLGSP